MLSNATNNIVECLAAYTKAHTASFNGHLPNIFLMAPHMIFQLKTTLMVTDNHNGRK